MDMSSEAHARDRGSAPELAELARLELTDAEVERFTQQLQPAFSLTYAGEVSRIDTTGVAPTAHVATAPRWREDLPGPSLNRATILDNAPDAAPAAPGSSACRIRCIVEDRRAIERGPRKVLAPPRCRGHVRRGRDAGCVDAAHLTRIRCGESQRELLREAFDLGVREFEPRELGKLWSTSKITSLNLA